MYRAKSPLRRACLLGAVNGFLIGGTIIMLIIYWQEYRQKTLESAWTSTGSYPLLSDLLPAPWFVVLLYSILVFAASSCLAHKFFTDRIKSGTLLWQVITFCAVVGGILLPLIVDGISSIYTTGSYMYERDISRSSVITFLVILMGAMSFTYLYTKLIQLLQPRPYK